MIEEAIDECLLMAGNGKKLEKCTFPIDSSLVKTNLSDIQSPFWGKTLAPQALLELSSSEKERNVRLHLALLDEKKLSPKYSLVHKLTLADDQPPVLGSLIGQGMFFPKRGMENVVAHDLNAFTKLVQQTQEAYEPVVALAHKIGKKIDTFLESPSGNPKLSHCRIGFPGFSGRIEVYSIDSRPVRSFKPPFVRETTPWRMIEIYLASKQDDGLLQDNLVEKLVLSEVGLPKITILEGTIFGLPFFRTRVPFLINLQVYKILLMGKAG